MLATYHQSQVAGNRDKELLQLPSDHPFGSQRVKTLSFYAKPALIVKRVMTSATSALAMTRRLGHRVEALRQSAHALQNSPCFGAQLG